MINSETDVREVRCEGVDWFEWGGVVTKTKRPTVLRDEMVRISTRRRVLIFLGNLLPSIHVSDYTGPHRKYYVVNIYRH